MTLAKKELASAIHKKLNLSGQNIPTETNNVSIEIAESIVRSFQAYSELIKELKKSQHREAEAIFYDMLQLDICWYYNRYKVKTENPEAFSGSEIIENASKLKSKYTLEFHNLNLQLEFYHLKKFYGKKNELMLKIAKTNAKRQIFEILELIPPNK